MRRLNESQKAVAESIAGSRVCIAGPGTGKTELMVQMIDKKARLDPSTAILALTFSKKAVQEVKHRLKFIGRSLPNVKVSTVHSFCWQVIAKEMPEGEKVRNKEFVESITELLKAHEFDTQLTKVQFTELANYIEYCIAANLEPDSDEIGLDIDLNQIIEKLAFSSSPIITYDSLIDTVCNYEKDNPGFLDSIGSRYCQIMVDEFQDLTPAQLDIVLALRKTDEDILLIGDFDQSIYGFRYVNLTETQRLIEGFTKYHLQESYRCSQEILDTANLILPESNRLRAIGGSKYESMSRVLVFDNEFQEINWLVNDVKRLIQDQGVPLKDIAILLRAPAASRFGPILKESLLVKGITFTSSFVDRWELEYVYLLENIFKIAIGGGTNEDWIKIFKYLPGLTTEVAEEFAMQRLLIRKGKLDLPVSAEDSFELLQDVLGKIKPSTNASLAVSEAYEFIMSTLDIDKIKAIREVGFLLQESTLTVKDLKELLGKQFGGTDSNSVYIGTIHSAKGKEWKYVYLPQLYEGNLPKFSRSRGCDLEEEQRILYVGITRAISDCRMSLSIKALGGQRFLEPCRFISNLKYRRFKSGNLPQQPDPFSEQ